LKSDKKSHEPGTIGLIALLLTKLSDKSWLFFAVSIIFTHFLSKIKHIRLIISIVYNKRMAENRWIKIQMIKQKAFHVAQSTFYGV